MLSVAVLLQPQASESLVSKMLEYSLSIQIPSWKFGHMRKSWNTTTGSIRAPRSWYLFCDPLCRRIC